MQILLENNQMISEQMLVEKNLGMYASAFNKVNIYVKRSVRQYKNAAINESNHYFMSSVPTYNSDIMFSLSEREAVNELFMQIRAHLVEEMGANLKAHQIAINEGLFDRLKKGANDLKDKATLKYDEIATKFKSAMAFIDELIKKGVSSVKEFIKAIGELLSRLGESVAAALRKLGAFKKEDEDEATSVNAEMLSAVEDEDEKNFFGYVVEYVQHVMSNKKATAELSINEGFGHNLAQKVANNKVLGFILNVAPGKKLSWWKSILVSIIGSLVICIGIPVVLTGLGVSAPTIVPIVFAVKIIWASRGMLRILINRELSRGNKQFFNFSTTIALIFSVLPIAMLTIPEVHDFVTGCVRKVFDALGLESVVNTIDEWLNNVAKHITGHYANYETVQEDGHWVKEQIESIRHDGDVHTNLMHGGDTATNYIDKLWSDSDISQFEGAPYLKSWLENIAGQDWHSSTQMLNSLPELSGDAPITAVLDGNTFQHVSREVLTKAIEKYAGEAGIHCELIDVTNDALYKASKHMAGVSYALVFDANATSPNAAIANEIMHKVAEDLHVHNVNTFGKIMNAIKDWGETYVEGSVNTQIVHKLYDTIIDVFSPIFIPFFNKDKWGDYMLRIGSNASGYPAYRVTKVEHLPVATVAEKAEYKRALNLLIKHMEDVQKAHKTELNAAIEQDKEENEGKTSKGFRNFFKREKTKHNENANQDKRELVVIYISGKQTIKDEDGNKTTKDLKDEMAVVIDPLTMMCADVAGFTRRVRNYPYFLKGVFSKLDFIPTKKNDNETKDFIYEMLNKTMESSIKACVSQSNGTMFVIKSEDDDKYVPADPELADKAFFDLGNLTPNEICDVLNGKIDAYTLMAGKFGTNVTMKADKEGNLKKEAKENKKVIEKKRWKKTEDGKFVEDKDGEFDFVDAKIIPFISRPKSEVYKELHDDKDVHDLLFDEDDNLDTAIIMDQTLNLKQFLYRPMQTFSKEDKVKLAEAINAYLKGKSKDEKINAYNATKTMIEIIWRGLYSAYRKHAKKRDSETSDDNLTPEEDKNK